MKVRMLIFVLLLSVPALAQDMQLTDVFSGGLVGGAVDMSVQLYDFVGNFRDFQPVKEGRYRDIKKVRSNSKTRSCEDTDGGQIYSVKGTVSGLDSRGKQYEKTDFCRVISERKKGGRELLLVEYSCDDSGRLSYTTHPCRDCREGICPSLSFIDERRGGFTGASVLTQETKSQRGIPTKSEMFTDRLIETRKYITAKEGYYRPTSPIVRWKKGGLDNTYVTHEFLTQLQRQDPIKQMKPKQIYPYYRYFPPPRARFIDSRYVPRYGISERSLYITPRYVTYRKDPYRGQFVTTGELPEER